MELILKKMHVLLGSCGVIVLSACGGASTSGGSPDGPPGEGIGTTSFESLSADAKNLMQKYESAPLSSVAAMPLSGSATYRGVAAYSLDSSDPNSVVQNADALSQIELSANFALSQIEGRAYDFKSFDPNITVEGQIDLEGSISGNAFSAVANGTTSESGYGESFDITYNGSVQGTFVGDSAQALVGAGALTGSAPGLGDFPVWMLMIAEP